MLDVEPLILDELDRLAAGPVPGADWPDVVVRVGRRRRPLLALAAAALVAFAVVAVAIAASFGGFREWLTGEPGKPAPATAQAAFDRSTRAWSGFPRSTSLRRLVSADVAGAHYELDGFRGAGGLCLRLIVTGSASASSLSCAPLADLRSAHAPALVLSVDGSTGLSGRKVRVGPIALQASKAAVTFGVLADGVDRVRISHLQPTPTRTFVSGDAFLAVSPNFSPFNATTKIVTAAGGTEAPVPFVRGATPLSFPPPVALPSPRGPATAERQVTGGAIRWFARREPRGQAVPPHLHHVLGAGKDVIFARMIAPDPRAPERMIVSVSPAGARYFGGRLKNNRQVCIDVVGGRYQGAGCWPAGRLFSTEPFTFGVDGQRGGQVMTVSGLASDDVAKLRLYTATGDVRPVPLNDNGYLAAATVADFPLRLVAYDGKGLIIGVKTIPGSFETLPAPAPTPAVGAKWTRVLHNASGSVYTVRSTTGGRCVAFSVGTGTGWSCDEQAVIPANGLQISIASDRKHSYVQGLAGSRVAALRLTLRNGRTIAVSPVRRYVLYRLPSAILHPQQAVKTIEGLDANGKVLVRQRG